MLYSNFHRLFNAIEKISELSIPREVQKALEDNVKYLKLSKKDCFLKAGEVPSKIAFVLSGTLRLFYIDDSGNDLTKCFCFKDSFISNYNEQAKESQCFIEALEDCELMTIDFSSFEKLTQDNLLWLKIINKFYDAISRYREERELSFLSMTATERYESFIKQYPEAELIISQQHIASFLGISPVSLSRIRSKLKNKN